MDSPTFNFTTPANPSQDFLTLVALGTLAVTLLVHLMVAVAVMHDAQTVRQRGIGLMFFGPLGWTGISFLTGLFGLLVYWLMHHSSWRRDVPALPTEAAEPYPREEEPEPPERSSRSLFDN